MHLSQIASRYISEFGLALVPIPRGKKGPTEDGWNKPGGYFTDPDLAANYFAQHPNSNLGAVLGPSRVVSIDVDDVEATNIIFSEFGIDIFALRDACPSMRGNPERFRIWFRAPEDIDLTRHALSWPVKAIDPETPNKKTFTVFELRAGMIQDVIAPSIHPDTGQPYEWITKITKGLTEIPYDILNFWIHWDVFKANAQAICPWAKTEPPKPKKTKELDSNGQNLIGEYNQANSIEDCLLRYGYKRIGKRFLSPSSGTKIPGINVFDDNRCWNHHASDPLCSDETGQPISPFDLYLHHEHNGDYKSAFKKLNPSWKPDRKQTIRKQDTTAPVTETENSLEHYIDYHSPLSLLNTKGKPLNHIENLREIIHRLGVNIRYNIITKEDEILIPGKCFTIDNKSNAALSWLRSECSRFEFSTTSVDDYVLYLADQNVYNPVATWIESKPWDGVERLGDLYNTIYCVNGSDNELKEILIFRWMLAAIAAAFSPTGVAAPGMLVIQGDQYLGKTKWFKSLVPEELGLWKDGMLLRPDNKDSVKQVCSFWLVELGELDSTFKKSDIAQLKAFITNKSDVLRRAFARKESHYARRTVFFGSVNPKQFLNDPTGNRRFWTIEAAEINHSHNLDMQQIWAEVLHHYKAGESYFLTGEELDLLNAHNEQFTSVDPIVERISSHLEWSDPETLWTWNTATDILISIGIDRPTKAEQNTAADAIRKMNGGKCKRTKAQRLLLAPKTAIRG